MCAFDILVHLYKFKLMMQKITTRLCVFISLLTSFAVGQNIDSLRNCIASQKGDAKAMSFLNLADAYYYSRDAISAYDAAAKVLDYTNDSLLLGKAYYRMGVSNFQENQTFLQIKNLNIASKYLIGLNDSLAANAMYFAHRGYQKNGMYPEALAKGLEELEFRKNRLKDDLFVTRVIQEIGYTYDRMNDYRKAIEWHKKSIISAKNMNDELSIGRGYGLIGIAYDELNVFDSALYYNKMAVEYFKKNKEYGYLSTWYSNIGNTYTKLNDLNNAEKYTLLSLEVGDKKEPNPITLINLSKILMDKKQLQQAEIILDSAMKETYKTGEKRFLSEGFLRYHELSLNKNDYKNALAYYKKYKENEDEMFSESKARHINEMSIQYETAEKEKEILIHRADIAEKELKLQRRGYTVIGLTGLTLVLGLLGCLFLKQQKLKMNQLHKENELKSALARIETQNKLQEQRLRISRDLHDNIGSQLTFVISSLDNLDYAYDINNQPLLNKLDQISDFTRETINELRDTIWAMNQSEISYADLQSRITNFIEKANLSLNNTSFLFEIDENLNLDQNFNSVDGMNIYRIIQEAVNNAIKYAHASEIEVLITKKLDKINFRIRDNGVGFDQKNVKVSNGILSMQKRAKDLCANLHIDSTINKGTEINLEL